MLSVSNVGQNNYNTSFGCKKAKTVTTYVNNAPLIKEAVNIRNVGNKATAFLSSLATLFGIKKATQQSNKSNDSIPEADYKLYTKQYPLDLLPEEYSIILPGGEELNMRKYLKQQSFECLSTGVQKHEVTVLDPNMTMEELKKYIPEIKYNEYVNRWSIPSKSSSDQYIDLSKENILYRYANKDYPNGHAELHSSNREFSTYNRMPVAISSSVDGDSRPIDINKLSSIYNQKVTYYSSLPYKLVLLPKGTTVKTKTTEVLKEDSVLQTYLSDGGQLNASILSPREFIQQCKPIENCEKSQNSYDKILSLIPEDELYITTPKGRKFKKLSTFNGCSGYKFDGIVFDCTCSWTTTGGRFGAESDYKHKNLSGQELDKLYDKYAQNALKRNCTHISLNSDNGRVDIWK